MVREWLYSFRSVLPRLLCSVLASSIILLNTSIDVNAKGLGTVNVGTGRVSSGWQYGALAEFEFYNTDYYYDTSDDDIYNQWTSESANWTSVVNVPMNMVSYQFPSNVDSVIMSLTSNIQYGFTLTVNGHRYLSSDASAYVREVALILNGKEYILPISSNESLVSKSLTCLEEVSTVDSEVKFLDLGSYVSFDLNDLKDISRWDMSLRVTFDMSITSFYDCEKAYAEVQPWVNWYVGTGTETFKFYCYLDGGTELQKDLIELQEEENSIADSQLGELQEQTEQQKEQTETQKGMLSKMTDFFGSFFDNLINSVIGLFVPSKEEMGGLFDRLMEFFNETFGFLFYPFDFLIDLVDLFVSSEHTDTTITFPGFSIMGMEVWKDMEIDLTEYEVTAQLFEYVRMVTGSIIAFGFINYIRRFFDKRFGGGGN